MDSIYCPFSSCVAHHWEIELIFLAPSTALEGNFGDNNLSVRDVDLNASVENKVTGAAVFTSCTELGCDRGHAEGHWTSMLPSLSLFALA